MDLIEKMPKSKSELKQVSGFCDIKVDKQGQDIIKIILKYKESIMEDILLICIANSLYLFLFYHQIRM